MIKYAQVVNGIVINIIESETDPNGINGKWIACGNIGVGWIYSGGVFTEPSTPPVLRYISVGAFFDRFGPFKWAILADTNPGVQALIRDCSVRKYIDLDNPALPYGLDMLIAAGFTIDKTAIITDEILPSEEP